MIRYLIATPVALLLLVLILLLMALLIQPTSTPQATANRLVSIDFIRAHQAEQPAATRPLENIIKAQSKPQPERPIAPISKPLALPDMVPHIKTDAISLPRTQLAPPVSLRDLVYEATPQPKVTSPEPIFTPKPILTPKRPVPAPAPLTPQFSDNLLPLHTPQPSYPRRARSRGIEGWVRVSFIIQTNGKVKGVTVLEASPAGIFDNTTRSAVANWTFKPQQLNGQATERKVEQTIRFSLQR